MHLVSRRIFVLAACLLLITATSFATVITFNNLPGDGTAIPDGYAGFNWINFYDMSAQLTPIGGSSAAPMPSYAFNKGGAAASFDSGNVFTLTSATLGTDWADGMGVEVLGLAHNQIVDRMYVALNNGVFKQVTFNWSGIDEVTFMAMGTPANPSNMLKFALTQLVVVQSAPEPASLLLLAPGFGLALARLRKLRPGK